MALKDIPQAFTVDDEEEVRVAVARYFCELGFDADEMSFEDQFSIQLGHTSLVLGQKPKRKRTKQHTQVMGRSDLLLTRYSNPIAIVETKAPDHALTEKDALQALSYARLLLDMAPYAIVTNGRETRVYDTFARTLDVLDTPTDSMWIKHGQQVLSIGEDLRSLAAHTLIGINAQTLHAFCQKQVDTALEDLKGSPQEAKSYIPKVYKPRRDAERQFTIWLSTDLPCFAVVGDSGFGKTTFMCASAEQLVAQGHFVLFYSAATLKNDLETAICNDFVWEFRRERRGLAHIVERFDHIASAHGEILVIFLDAMDEYPGKREVLKAEILDLVSRLKGRSIRLCLSCKSYDWGEFIIESARSYNRLATSTSPDVKDLTSAPADPHRVGMWLQEYTDGELEQIFPKYRNVFSLQGDLRGTTRNECRVPLILRLFSEVWSGRNETLPEEISQREVFEAYWNMKLSRVQHRLAAERWMTEVAKMTVESGERQIDLAKLCMSLPFTETQDETYQALIRCGLLRVTRDAYGYQKLSFGLEKIRSYIYTFKVQTWPQKVQEGRFDEVAVAICDLLKNPLGAEAAEFYLRAVDRGETQLLMTIALHDIRSFVRLVEILRVKSSVFTYRSGEEQQQALLSHLKQYAIAYSDLSRHYFPDLCERIEPYAKGAIGLWFAGSLDDSTYQFRLRTQSNPDPLVVLPLDVAIAIVRRQFAVEFYGGRPEGEDHDTLWPAYEALQPVGEIRYDLLPDERSSYREGMSGIVDGLPQKMAWNHILSQVAKLLVTRYLDETTSPALLRERAWKILREDPLVFPAGIPNTGKYWQALGFQSIQEVSIVSIDELMSRTHNLLKQYEPHLTGRTELVKLRWYSSQTSLIHRLYYALRCLQQKQLTLGVPLLESHDPFKYHHTGNLMSAVEVVTRLLPYILEAYDSLARQNLLPLANELSLIKFPDASLLVELTRQPSDLLFRNDFLRVTYVILPSVILPEKYIVYTSDTEDSIANESFQTLQGGKVKLIASLGATFRRGRLTCQIGDLYVNEPNAIFYITRFPSHHPLVDQVYQLLGSELSFLLRGDYHWWTDLAGGNINDTMLDWWISRNLD